MPSERVAEGGFVINNAGVASYDKQIKLIAEKREIPSSAESYDEAKAKRFWQLACQVTGCNAAALPA